MKGLDNLLPNTQRVLRRLALLPILHNYAFVGGSALAVYLGHRLSEDIDLFTWKSSLDTQEIRDALQGANFQELRLVNLTERQADFVIEGVKVTFFANGWTELRRREQIEGNLFITELQTLAVMKVNTLFLRAKYRDYYDLFIISQECFSLEELFEFTKERMNNLNKTLFQRALIFTEDITDESIQHLRPKQQVSLSDIASHFQQQIQIWNNPKT